MVVVLLAIALIARRATPPADRRRFSAALAPRRPQPQAGAAVAVVAAGATGLALLISTGGMSVVAVLI
jgi:hypothetical protein